MKKHFILSMVILTFSVINSTYAQQRGQESATPQDKANKVAGVLQKKLGLSDEQKQKVYDQTMVTLKATREIKAEKRNDPKGLISDFKNIRKDFDLALKEFLTADQYQKFEKIKADAKAERMQGEQIDASKAKSRATAEEEDPELELDEIAE